MNEPDRRKTIPEQLMEAQQEIARLRAENQPTKALVAQLAEVRAQLETAKSANSALLTRIAALQAAQGAMQETATVPAAATTPIPAAALQTDFARLEATVAKKKSELAAARSKHDCVAIARLELELANSRAALLAARTKMDHARLDAELTAKINHHTQAGTLGSEFDRADSDQAQQAATIANTTAKLKAATTLQEQIVESYREKLGIR